MKVKELHKTVNVAWSPPSQYPILMAAGTAAQQLDASFSTNASLDLYLLNLQQPGYEMQLSNSVMSDERFHKIIWGSYGNNPAGIIVGGCDYGKIKIYSAAKMLANDSNSLISSLDRHEGPVKAMDFNPFKPNLLATGATHSEIYIWDLNMNKPAVPGSKSVPDEDVQHIEWNKQVEVILASTFSQRCVIWDLRKNEAIIKLTDANSRVRWKCVQWHPDVATQLCLASEDDQAPIIELWDLRFATSPLKTLHNHQRGVLALAWNAHDSDLLLSCAKDNRILCWNPNSDAPNGEVVCELAQTNQWNFDVSWCPRHPGLIAGTSFDGLATVYSLLGGHNQGSVETSNKIVDSFPGMDPFTQPLPTVQAEATATLKKAPKWLKRPFGASFGFGGKLIIFENEPVDPNMPANSNRKVFISQVVLNPELIQRSNELETALKSGRFSDFCKEKVNNTTDEYKKKVWSCIGAYFGENVTQDLLGLLGYNIDEINDKLNKFLPTQDVNAVTEGISNLNKPIMNGNALDGSSAFDAIAEQEQNKLSLSKNQVTNKPIDSSYRIYTSDDDNGLITQAILLGNIEAAVALCFENKRYADAVILSMTGGPDLLAQTQYRYFTEHTGPLNFLINSLVSENWIDVVKNCDINCWKEAIVGVFTHTSPEERSVLCDILGDRLAASENANHRKDAQICYICSGNLNKTIESSESDIQESVELVSIMQRALEFHSMRKINIEGNIATILTRYAEMLAAEGDLDSALSYLGDSQEPRIVMLRDRLYQALGNIRSGQQTTNLPGLAPTNMYASNEPRKSVSGILPSMPGTHQTQQPPSWNVAPTKQSPYGTVPANSYAGPVMGQSYSNVGLAPVNQFLPAASASADPYGQAPLTPAVPPPPPTGSQSSNLSGSRPPSVGPHSRSKYIIDPSVKSGPTYGSSGFPQTQQMYSGAQQYQQHQQQHQQQQQQQHQHQQQQHHHQQHQQHQQQQQQQHQHHHQQQQQQQQQVLQRQPQTQPPSQAQMFPTPGSFPGQSPYSIQQPQQMGSFGSYGRAGAQGSVYSDLDVQQQQQQQQQHQLRSAQPNVLTPNPVKPQAIYDPGSVQQPVQSLGYPNEMTYQAPPQSSGWNDPPVAKSTSAQPKSEFQRQDAILQPLRSAPAPEHNAYQQNLEYQQQQNYQDPQAIYNQYSNNVPPQGVQQFKRPPESLQPAQPAQTIRAPEPEKPKQPISSENLQLQTTFNELKDQCFENAKNPQVRRKIEEVSRKLDVFYDCLRDQKISQNTLQGLHQICKLVQAGDYAGGLSVHTQLVSGPDFSQIASFMPGIKVLLQCALQLGVYIR